MEIALTGVLNVYIRTLSTEIVTLGKISSLESIYRPSNHIYEDEPLNGKSKKD